MLRLLWRLLLRLLFLMMLLLQHLLLQHGWCRHLLPVTQTKIIKHFAFRLLLALLLLFRNGLLNDHIALYILESCNFWKRLWIQCKVGIRFLRWLHLLWLVLLMLLLLWLEGAAHRLAEQMLVVGKRL